MTFIGRNIISMDGLRLHARDYGPPSPRAVLCLPGLARNAADFDPLALCLTRADPELRLVAVDYRGRGLSAWDPDPSHYDLHVESKDILAAVAALGIERAVVVGTSRGGLHATILAGSRPDLVEGVVLNDIGPVLEPAGLARIQGYVGKLPAPRSWIEAVAALKRVAGAQFTALSEEDWRHYARTTFEERRDGSLAVRYDPALQDNLAKLDPYALPALWDSFEALNPYPLLIVRGENSDLLSLSTVAEMAERHPACTVLTVRGQGHAPLLTDATTLDDISAFVARCRSKGPA